MEKMSDKEIYDVISKALVIAEENRLSPFGCYELRTPHGNYIFTTKKPLKIFKVERAISENL